MYSFPPNVIMGFQGTKENNINHEKKFQVIRKLWEGKSHNPVNVKGSSG